VYATGGSSAARRAPCQPPSGGTNTTLPVVPEARQKAPMPATPESGAISHSRVCFASESRQARTCVRNWRIECRKARSGKARSLRELISSRTSGRQTCLSRPVPGRDCLHCRPFSMKRVRQHREYLPTSDDGNGERKSNPK